MMAAVDTKRSTWSIAHNLRLLLKQLAKWGSLTLVVVAVVGGVNAYYLSQNYGLTPVEIAVALVGIAAAIAFLKAACLFMSYQFFNEAAFEGSFFVTAMLVALFLMVALGCVALLVNPRVADFPSAELLWVFPLIYGVVSVVLFITFRLSYWMFRR